jgi:hypothetical protein
MLHPCTLKYSTVLLQFSFCLLYSHSVPSYNSSAWTPCKMHVTFCQECVFIGSLPSSGCPSIVESVTSGMFLLSRCLAIVICVTILSYVRVTLNGVLDWILDLLTTLPHDLELQVITVPLLISTLYKSPQHPLSLFQPAVPSPTVPWQQLLTVEILQLLRSVLYEWQLPSNCPLTNCH